MLKRVFDIVGWLGTALVLAALAVFFSKPSWQAYSQWLSWGGLVCLLVYAIGQWRDLVNAFGGRSTRLGTISIASVLVVLGILVAINYISSREHKRWDLTASGEFTLSPQTAKVLASLDSPLKMTAFARETEFGRYKERLPEYQYLSKKVALDYVDPDKKPSVARQMGIQSYGTIAIEYKGRIERVVGDSEQDITNGVIKVVTGQERKIYFTQGHGEKDTTSAERAGYNGIAAQLGRDNFKVDRIVLAQQSDVPADATALVAAGPKVDFLPAEIDAMKRYLDKGGKVMLMIDPPDKADAPPLTNLLALAHDWAIDVANNVVVDVSGVGRLLGTDETYPVAAKYPNHPIVDKFELLTAFPLARSVGAVAGGVNGRTAQTFVETGPRSWMETDVAGVIGGKPIKFDEAKGDKMGPAAIGAAVSAAVATADDKTDAAKKDGAQKQETRLVVFGDSDFAANFALGIQGNRDLFMNALNWLSQQENLIAIRPRESADRRVTMTSGQQVRVLLLVLLVIPGFVLGSGVYTWWRRR
jgi:ABC-type uncharacterized transport system involved in gliding motility auxiliary subunit